MSVNAKEFFDRLGHNHIWANGHEVAYVRRDGTLKPETYYIRRREDTTLMVSWVQNGKPHEGSLYLPPNKIYGVALKRNVFGSRLVISLGGNY